MSIEDTDAPPQPVPGPDRQQWSTIYPVLIAVVLLLLPPDKTRDLVRVTEGSR